MCDRSSADWRDVYFCDLNLDEDMSHSLDFSRNCISMTHMHNNHSQLHGICYNQRVVFDEVIWS